MDIGLPGSTGIECIRKLKPHHPWMQFVIFTVYEDSDQVFEALAAGASGYLLKNSAPDKIITSLQELHAGGSPMSLSIARRWSVPSTGPLTKINFPTVKWKC
jgi:DNA-binding NarL/FixJ family response regulator